jgi:hypothetical protein
MQNIVFLMTQFPWISYSISHSCLPPFPLTHFAFFRYLQMYISILLYDMYMIHSFPWREQFWPLFLRVQPAAYQRWVEQGWIGSSIMRTRASKGTQNAIHTLYYITIISYIVIKQLRAPVVACCTLLLPANENAQPSSRIRHRKG